MERPTHELDPGLIEREYAFERTLSAIDEAHDGRGSVLLVEGPAGIGKTALLRQITADAEERGADVLTASGRRSERLFGFGVVVQLFESRIESAEEEERDRLLEEAAREAVPIFTPGNRQVEPTFDVLHGLYRISSRLADVKPLAVIVDDVDLADWQSLRYLLYLTERIDKLPVALVLAAGSVPGRHAPELVGEIARHPSTSRCELLPLTGAGTAERVRAIFPEADDEACERVYAATAGFPFLVDALAAELAGVAGPAADAISAWVLGRAAQFHPGAPGLVKAVAVLGAECELRHAAALSALDAEAAASIVDVLGEAGILAPSERLALAQPAVADAVRTTQAPAERAASHLSAARLLSQEQVYPEIVASHLLEAARTGSPWVVDALCRGAAIALGRGSPADAVNYLRRALEERPAARQRAHVVLELGRAEAMAGEPEAIVRLSEALSSTESKQDPASALATGRALVALGRPGQAVRVYERARAELGDADPALDERLKAAGAVAAWITQLSAGGEVVAVPRPPAADTPAERTKMALAAVDAAMRGRPCPEIRALAEDALARGGLLDDETSDGPTYYLAAIALAVAEDFQTAEAALTAAVADAERRGSVLGFSTASEVRSWTILRRGRVGDAAADAHNALGSAGDGRPFGMQLARLVLADCLVEQGDLSGAGRELAAAMPRDDLPSPIRLLVLASRGRLRLLEQKPKRALDDFLACRDLAERTGVTNPAVAPWRSGAGLAYAALGDAQEAERLIASELAAAESFAAPGPVGRALRRLATIRDPESGVELLASAVDTLDGSQAALERARALVEYGAALRRLSKRKEAREPLRAGLEIAQGCAAEVLTQRAMREATSAGARPRRTALSGVESLTERERQVAALAAAGRSNREIANELFVSLKTVEFHLGHAYQKLGVRSRDRLREFFD